MFLYIKEGRSFGPVAGEEIVALADRGVLRGDDLVRHQSLGSWRRVDGLVEALRAGRLPSGPPPRPSRGSVPAGAHTVFTSAPPVTSLPPAPALPQVGGQECRRCHVECSADARFCRRCGAPLPGRHCVACGRRAQADAVYCEGCGDPLPPPDD